jgi:hypothetical protein
MVSVMGGRQPDNIVAFRRPCLPSLPFGALLARESDTVFASPYFTIFTSPSIPLSL